MRIILIKLVFATFLFFAVQCASADEYKSAPFDYSKASNIIVYTSDGQKSIWFPKPLETTHSRGPAILYRDILSAMSESQPATMPPGEPMYIIDIQSENNYKRISIGEDWLSDGESISVYDDLNPVLNHIKSRIQVGALSDYSTRHAEVKYSNLKFDGESQNTTGEIGFSEEDEKKSIDQTLEKVASLVEESYQLAQGEVSKSSLKDALSDKGLPNKSESERSTATPATKLGSSSEGEVSTTEVKTTSQNQGGVNEVVSPQNSTEGRSPILGLIIIMLMALIVILIRKLFLSK